MKPVLPRRDSVWTLILGLFMLGGLKYIVIPIGLLFLLFYVF